MGLDMYAYKCPVEMIGAAQVDFDTDKVCGEKVAYWRKFNNLHGWMARLYVAKGGKQEFNCVPVRLMPEDIDALEQATQIPSIELHPTVGFFFGGQEPMDGEMIAEVVAFCVRARELFADGFAVYYTSWW